MENQTNISDQNIQQMGNNPVGQPVSIPEKPKLNYWMILTILFVFLFFLLAGVNFLYLKTASEVNPLPYSTIPPTKPVGRVSFMGTVKTGAQLGEVKSFCSNGLYLVADEGAYLVNQTRMLQLRLPNQPDGTKMLSDQKYVGKKVAVVGKYPAQEDFCLALICGCEDYLL